MTEDWKVRASALSDAAWAAVTKSPDFTGSVQCGTTAHLAIEMAEHLGVAAQEIDRLRMDVERKQIQYERTQRYWVDAARKAIAGDSEHLRLRVDLAESGPIALTETNSQ